MKKHLFFISFLLTLLLLACENANNSPNSTELTTHVPKQLSYHILNIYPHDTTYFTEGFELHNGKLLESTGNYGTSLISWQDLRTNTKTIPIKLPKTYFGEGITLLNGKIYQLTYKENTCFVYDAKTYKKINSFVYEGEGWGMTNNGKELIMSNGTSNLYFRNPENFSITQTLSVKNNYGLLSNLNELEYVEGNIFANLWMTNKIIKIDSKTGQVLAELDLSDVLQKYPATNSIDFLNGIAFDSSKNTFFITGKYYPKIFEMEIH